MRYYFLSNKVEIVCVCVRFNDQIHLCYNHEVTTANNTIMWLSNPLMILNYQNNVLFYAHPDRCSGIQNKSKVLLLLLLLLQK